MTAAAGPWTSPGSGACSPRTGSWDGLGTQGAGRRGGWNWVLESQKLGGEGKGDNPPREALPPRQQNPGLPGAPLSSAPAQVPPSFHDSETRSYGRKGLSTLGTGLRLPSDQGGSLSPPDRGSLCLPTDQMPSRRNRTCSWGGFTLCLAVHEGHQEQIDLGVQEVGWEPREDVAV